MSMYIFIYKARPHFIMAEIYNSRCTELTTTAEYVLATECTECPSYKAEANIYMYIGGRVIGIHLMGQKGHFRPPTSPYPK